jgi:hypothetical protein
VSIIYLPNLGTRVCLIRGGEAFNEANFTHDFLFLMYDVYLKTVSSLIKESYDFALLLLPTLPEV